MDFRISQSHAGHGVKLTYIIASAPASASASASAASGVVSRHQPHIMIVSYSFILDFFIVFAIKFYIFIIMASIYERK